MGFYVKHKKSVVVFLATVAVMVAGVYGYNNAGIVKIGQHSTYYSYGDVFQVKSLSNELARMAGAKDSDQIGAKAAFQALVVAGAQKELADALKIGVNKDVALNMAMQSPYRGLLEQKRKSLGEDRFYRLFVEPMAMGEIFKQYYNAADPKRKLADEALALATSAGITAAAQKVGSTVKEAELPRTEQNALLFEAAGKAGEGRLLPQVIEDNVAFYVFQVKSIGDKSMKADILTIQRTAPGEFLNAELQKNNIPIAARAYSVFRTASFFNPGGVLAKEEPRDKK
jgi:hypothetical protein